MKYVIEQRGARFLVINDTTQENRGSFLEKKEAVDHAEELNRKHQEAVGMVHLSNDRQKPSDFEN